MGTWLVLLRDLSNQTKHEEIPMLTLDAFQPSSNCLLPLPLPKPFAFYTWTLFLATKGCISFEDSKRIAEDWQKRRGSEWKQKVKVWMESLDEERLKASEFLDLEEDELRYHQTMEMRSELSKMMDGSKEEEEELI